MIQTANNGDPAARVEWHWEADESATILSWRDQPVCQFEPDKVVLREIRLRPGGESLIGGAGCPMGWRLFWGTHETMVCDEFQTFVKEEEAILRVRSHEKDQPEAQQFEVVIRKTDRGFEYEAQSSIEAHADIFGRESKLEFMNFLPTWMTLPGVSGFGYLRGVTDSMRQKAEYQYYGLDAEWEFGLQSLVPLNLLYLSNQADLHLRPDGIVAAIDSPRGNPGVQLLGRTASYTTCFLCNAMWDLHLVHNEYAHARQQRLRGRPVLLMGERRTAHFRVFQLSDHETNGFRRKGVVRRIPDAETQLRRFPALRLPVTRFDAAVNPNDHDPSRFFTPWVDNIERGRTPAGLHLMPPHYEPGICSWEAAEGKGWLQVETRTLRTAGWQLCGVNTIPIRTGTRYRIAVEVQTHALTGKGAWLAIARGDQDLTFCPTLTATQWTNSIALQGTREWTLLALEFRLDKDIVLAHRDARVAPRIENRVRVAFVHSGCGLSRFRQLRCEEISSS